MNLDAIESVLVRGLERLLGKAVEVVPGPEVIPALGGMRPMVFVHAARFVDGGGVSDEGARIARRPVTAAGGLAGFAEERPGRVVVEVVCVSSAYAALKELCSVVSPRVLRSLESLHELALGELSRGSVSLKFADLTASLHAAEFVRRETEGVAYFAGCLAFRLDGFLHVRVMRRGGLQQRAPGVDRPD